MKGKLSNAEPRTCLVCGEQFIPSRNKQWFCPRPRRCRDTSKAVRLIKQMAAERGETLDPRPCEKCGTIFKPRATDQKTCGTSCPGKPDFVLTCANPRCELPERDEHGRHLLAGQCIVPGNSRGKGNQAYCSRRCRELNAPYRLRERFRRYGVTPEQYQEMVAEQDNRCAICGEPPSPPPTQSWRDGDWALAVDHDHKTDELRDPLCHRHNLGIGLFDDNPDLLRAAADYIERHRNGTCPRPWHTTTP